MYVHGVSFPGTILSTLYILIDLIFKQHLGIVAIVILILQLKKMETLRGLAQSKVIHPTSDWPGCSIISYASATITAVWQHKIVQAWAERLSTKKHNVPWSTIHQTQKKTSVLPLFFISADRETESLRE